MIEIILRFERMKIELMGQSRRAAKLSSSNINISSFFYFCKNQHTDPNFYERHFRSLIRQEQCQLWIAVNEEQLDAYTNPQSHQQVFQQTLLLDVGSDAAIQNLLALLVSSVFVHKISFEKFEAEREAIKEHLFELYKHQIRLELDESDEQLRGQIARFISERISDYKKQLHETISSTLQNDSPKMV